MVPMTFISWIYHFWAQFWPYFNFVDFRAYFGPFSLVNRDRQKMADLLMKMASNQKMQENKPTLKFNFTIEKRWPVSKFSFWHSHWALVCIDLFHGGQTVVLAGCYGGWRPKSCEILYHLNWLKICGWRFGRAIGVLDIEKKSVFPFADFFWSEQKV